VFIAAYESIYTAVTSITSKVDALEQIVYEIFGHCAVAVMYFGQTGGTKG